MRIVESRFAEARRAGGDKTCDVLLGRAADAVREMIAHIDAS